MSKLVYLSYILDENTPTYGNRNKFIQQKKSNITNGDVANDTSIETTVHIGTHIDMPYHFFENGQTIEEFDINFFNSTNVLFVNIKPSNIIIKDELIKILEKVENKNTYEFLIIKTGICHNEIKKNFGNQIMVLTQLLQFI